MTFFLHGVPEFSMSPQHVYLTSALSETGLSVRKRPTSMPRGRCGSCHPGDAQSRDHLWAWQKGGVQGSWGFCLGTVLCLPTPPTLRLPQPPSPPKKEETISSNHCFLPTNRCSSLAHNCIINMFCLFWVFLRESLDFPWHAQWVVQCDSRTHSHVLIHGRDRIGTTIRSRISCSPSLPTENCWL